MFGIGGGVIYVVVFFFQAEDGIRDLVRSRGLGDVYKRQVYTIFQIDRNLINIWNCQAQKVLRNEHYFSKHDAVTPYHSLSLIHI